MQPKCQIPDIKLKDAGDSLYTLPPSDEMEFGENISFMMMRTSNTYDDCMRMPFVVLLNTIRNIRINDLIQNNPDWREAYFKQLTYERISKNKALAQTGMDVSGLKSFAQKL